MTWLVGDGFDFYNNSFGSGADSSSGAAPLWTAGPAAGNLTSVTRFGVGKSFSPSNTGVVIYRDTGSNDPEIVVNYAWLYNQGLVGANPLCGVTLGDGSTAQCAIVMFTDGSLRLLSGGVAGSTLATYSAAFISGTWAHFQVRVVINNTTGSIRVRKDGAPSDSFSASALNSRGGTTNNYANRINIGGAANPTNSNYYDDFYCFNTTGAAPNDWQGDVRCIQRMVAADPSTPKFARFPSGNASNFSCMNEAAEDGDTSYTFDSTVGDEDDYGIQALGVVPTAIVAVQAKVFVKKSDAGARSGDLVLTSASASQNFGSTALSSTYGYLSLPLTTDPATSAAWTAAGVNALKVGPKVTA